VAIEKIDEVSLMFEAARSFTAGAKIIVASDGIEDDEGVSVPTLPVIMCAAFAVELSLKALLCVEGRTRPMGDGHDLDLLFSTLSTERQAAFLAMQQHFTELDPDSARAAITQLKDTFKVWRYPYEHSFLETAPATLVGLALALSEFMRTTLKIERSDNGWLKRADGILGGDG
jgi:hypothetical protein